MTTRLAQVLEKIDHINSEDPHREIGDGTVRFKEVVYSERVTNWVLKLDSNASDVLRIAARGQHIRRWTMPRDSYPMDRGGYLRWREDLKKMHAQTVADLMKECGYDETEAERARILILKKNLRTDTETQTLEDALCLVFLETQFSDLIEKTPPEKMVTIVRKTWGKMSSAAKTHALQLKLKPDENEIIKKALAVG